MRRVVAIAVATGALCAPAAARASVGGPHVVAHVPGAAGMSAVSGHAVFSRRVRGRWRLQQWHAGRIQTLPAPSRAVPFDADAGTDARDHPVVVYSVCRQDPRSQAFSDWTRATGCHVAQMSLEHPGPPATVPGTDVPGVSATTPSMVHGTLAYARHADGATTPDVVLGRPGEAPRTLPPAPLACDYDCDDRGIRVTITALDAGAYAVAFIAEQTGGDPGGIAGQTTLQLDPGSGAPRVLSVGFVDGACGYVRPQSPTAIGRGAFWVAEGSPCSDTVTDLALVDGERLIAHVEPGLVVAAARDGRDSFWLRATGPRIKAFSPSALTCSQKGVRCALVRARKLPFHAVKRGTPLGPYPEDG